MADDPGKLKFTRPADGSGTLRMGDYSPPAPKLQNGLLFRRPADGSGKLVFGYTVNPGNPVTPAADLALDASFSGDMAAHIGLAPAAGLGIDAGFADDMPASIGAAWDANVSRGPRHHARAHWQDAAHIAAATASRWQQSDTVIGAASAHWQDAARLAAAAAPGWQDTARLRHAVAPHWQDAAARRHTAAPHWQDTTARRHAVAPHWQDPAPVRHATAVHWQEMARRRHTASLRWQDATAARRWLHDATQVAAPLRALLRHHWQDARKPPPGRYPWPAPPDPNLCYDPARLGLLVFERPFVADGKLVFICRKAGDDPGPQPGAIVVPIRRVYIVTNDIQLIRVAGSVPLPAHAFALSLDADSWTWQWSATLHASALAAITPATLGTPVEVQATINSVPYRLLIERVQRNRQFAQERINVSGRGLAAILDAPYAPVMDFGNPAGARSAQQLTGDVLTVNGVSMDWDVDWGLTDWAVPAGTWQHQGSYISALNAIAQAAGGYVQPHATAQTLRILHRYPLAPWDWTTVTPDVELPLAVTSVEGIEWVKKPVYNRVYVSGADGSGILGQVSIAGTPGDEAAPMATDALITHLEAARQRGRAILADTGPQAMVTLTLPVLPETGLILPGQFVRRTDGAHHVQGYVRSTSLQWARPRLRQTIEVQTHG